MKNKCQVIKMKRTGLEISNEISNFRTQLSFRKRGKTKDIMKIENLEKKLKELLEKQYEEVV